MALRDWLLKTPFANTAAAHGMRDAAREFPGAEDSVAIRLYTYPPAESVGAPEQETIAATSAPKGVTS